MADDDTTSAGEAGDRPTILAAERLEAIFARLPAAIAVVEGPHHRFELVNDAYRDLVGGRDVLGLTVAEALPELEGQGFIELLDNVFCTGEPRYGLETSIFLDSDGGGALVESFLNFAYLPARSATGEVDGILVHAVDVTELVVARRTVEALAEQLAGDRRQLEALVEQMPAGVVIAEAPSGRLLAANHEWRDFFGVSLEAVGSIAVYDLFSAYHRDGRQYAPEEYPLARSVAHGEVVVGEQMTIRRADGRRRVIEVNSAPIVNEGRTEACVATFFDATEQRLASLLVERNKAMLELVAGGAPLAQTLDSLVRMVEDHSDGAVLASVHVLDRDGVHLRHGAAPSLPSAYNEAIDGIEIGPAVGSCGTAAYRREPVVVRDIAGDPLWVDFRDVALEHELHACWSTPIFSASGDVIGTFALYYRDERTPSPAERELVEIATRTAAVAIEHKRLEEDSAQLLAVEQAARTGAERNLQVVEALHRVGQAINASLELQEVMQVVTDAATELTRAELGAFFYNVLREDGETYMLYTLSGAPRSVFDRFPMPRDSAVFDPTFRGAVVRLDDVHADPRYGISPPYYGIPEGHPPVRSYLAVPVKNVEGAVLGGLFFGHSDAGIFTEEAEHLAVGIAAQAAIAIERAQLYFRERRARAEAERRAQAALALEHVNEGVCLVDSDGVIRIWNLAATSITGLAATDVVGRSLDTAVPSLAAIAGQIPTVEAPETGGAVETLPVSVEGRKLALAISGIRLPTGVVYTFRDRTEERRLEQLRSDIVATVSHELRTPLAAVFGAGRTLGRPEVSDNPELRDRLVQMIVEETERLTRVVNEILVVSDLEARSHAVSLAPVDLVELVRKAADLAAVRDSGVAIELDAEEVPAVLGDEDRLQQVVANLIDNAIKYGGSGGRVDVRVRSRLDRVRLGVVDYGPGVPLGEAERIFERFYRLDPQQRQGIAGTGLGLYISRELVRAMGGEIWMEPNRGGRGSTFVVELRAAG